MKYSPITFIAVISLFLVCQFFGLFVATSYKTVELPYSLTPPAISGTEAVVMIIISLIVMTFIFYLFSRLKHAKLLKLWFSIALIICISISLSLFIGDVLAIIIAVVITIIRLKEKELYVHNLSEILLYGGLAALFAPLFNLFTILLLLLIISVYDYFSVFITKHMITLAKSEASTNLFTGLLIRNGDEQAMLGGGDIAFTLLFATIISFERGLFYGFLSIYLVTACLLGLIVLGKKGKFYPAMPILSIGCSITYLLSLIL